MQLVTLDFESFFSDEYTLKKMTTIEYVTDSRFKLHGVGIQLDGGEPVYHYGSAIEQALRAIDWSNACLLCHNAHFDGFILWYHFNIIPARYADTESMARSIAHWSSASLEVLCQLLWPNDTSRRKGKELVSFKGIEILSDEQQIVMGGYCCNDVRLTYLAYNEMLAFYPDSELDIIDITVRMFCSPRVVLNAEFVEQHVAKVEEEKAALLAASGYPKTTLSSNQRFAAMLLDEHGITVPTKTSKQTGKPTLALAKDDLEFHKLVADHPQLDAVWKARRAVKSTGEVTRGHRFLDVARRCHGLLPIPLNHWAAITGRWGGAEKMNCQNLPRLDKSPLRLSLTAAPGRQFVIRDLSQIEARTLAWWAGQDDLLGQFARKEDVYSIFASDVYGRVINRKRIEIHPETGKEYKPDELEGFVGKVCVLGLGYGMGPPTFVVTMAKGAMGGPPVYFTAHEGRHIVNTYRSKNHRITALWGEADRVIFDMACPGTDYDWGPFRVQSNRLILPNGLAINYPRLREVEHPEARNQFMYWNGDFDKNIYGGLLVENGNQALAGCVIKDMMVACIKEMHAEGIDAQIILQVHDEVVFDVPEDRAMDADRIAGEIMGCPLPWCPDLPVASEGGISGRYSK